MKEGEGVEGGESHAGGGVTFGQMGFDSCQASGRIADARATPVRIFDFIYFVFTGLPRFRLPEDRSDWLTG